MRTVTNVLQPLTSDLPDNTSPDGWCCDLRCYRVTAPAAGWPGPARLDSEVSWPGETRNTRRTGSAPTWTARGSRARSAKRATSAATPRGTQRALLLPLALAASHAHISTGTVALAVTIAAALCVLVALARPTRPCRRCHGERVAMRRRWLTGRSRLAPCRR